MKFRKKIIDDFKLFKYSGDSFDRHYNFKTTQKLEAST